MEFAKTQLDPNLPKGWSKYTKGSSAYNRIHGDPPKQRKKPTSQIEAEERREVENKKKKFKEFLAVMMAKGKKGRNQQWNESFTDFIPTDTIKSRRERKREEKINKEVKDQERLDKINEEHQNHTTKEDIVQKDGDVTIIQKDINRRSTKLGGSKATQVHIKFGKDADIDTALEKIGDNIALEKGDKDADHKEVEEEEVEEIDQNRLYVMNLPFAISEDELREYFGGFGEIDEISIPLRKGGLGTGFGFIRYMEPESAVNAFGHLDKKIFQGRILTILPASKRKEDKKPEQEFEPLDEIRDEVQEEAQPKEEIKTLEEKSSFKAKKKVYMKRNFDDETNWNYLFLSQDAVTEVIANKLSLRKGDILNKDDDNLAVRVANIETQIIRETKDWMIENGINLKAIEGKDNRKDCKRSKTILLIKNLSCKNDAEKDLKQYAQTDNLIVSPSRTLAIAKYKTASQAEAVMKKLCYYRLNGIPLYLEYAPQAFESSQVGGTPQPTVDESMVESTAIVPNTVYVKNLNFDTSEQKLREVFEKAISEKPLSVKIIRNKEDGLQSQGYGFVEYETEDSAKNSIRKLQHAVVDDHMIQLKLSKRDNAEVEKKKRLEKLKRKQKDEESFIDNDDLASNKIMIKNLAFEANKKDIMGLFKEAGQIKKVRLPKKPNSNSHRGFGFVEFVTVEDAKGAFETMQHSHLYGRKLVIQWAKKTDEINDVKELRQKVSQQQEMMKESTQSKKRAKLIEAADSDQDE